MRVVSHFVSLEYHFTVPFQERIQVGPSKPVAIFLCSLLHSGRVYGDTRMDTFWAFRQAFVHLILADNWLSTSAQIRQGTPNIGKARCVLQRRCCGTVDWFG